jgi:hypothetical protein
MTFQEILNDAPLLLAYLICIACLVQLFMIFFVERVNIITDLRGKDKMWQFLELSGLAWLVIFPTVVVTSLFGIEVQTGVWASLDAVYFMNLGGKMGTKWLDSKNPPSKDDKV